MIVEDNDRRSNSSIAGHDLEGTSGEGNPSEGGQKTKMLHFDMKGLHQTWGGTQNQDDEIISTAITKNAIHKIRIVALA